MTEWEFQKKNSLVGGGGGGFVFSAGTTGTLSRVVQVTRVGEVDVTVVMLL